MSSVIIGDVHGCFDALQRLLDAIGPAADDRIISAGDFVDRGPQSPDCADFFMAREAVMGNHEYKHVRHRDGILKKLSPSQLGAIEQYRRAGKDYLAAVSYMATLPFYLNLPEALVVHAGVEDGIPLEQQSRIVLVGGMSAHSVCGINPATGAPFWCERYPKDAKPVIFGHLSIHKPFPYRDNLYPIDTGCCAGGKLTAVTLPEFRVYQVDGWNKI